MDKIRAYYIDPVKHPLSPALTEIKERLTVAYNLKVSYFSNQQIVNKWIKEYGLSEAQAYIDIKNAQLLFGQVNKLDRDAKRNILYEYGTAMLIRARERGDQKAEGKAIDLLGKFAGLSEEDIAQFNPEKFEKVEVTIGLPKELQEHLINNMSGGVADFNSFDATTIEYEEIEEDDEEKEAEDGSI